jgi:hypothetical protein
MRTQAGKSVEVVDHEGDREYGEQRIVTTYYPADFRHSAQPSRPIVGVVRDKDTKLPLAGAMVRSYARRTGPSSFRIVDIVKTTTDAEGRYRLTGLPKGDGYRIAVVPTHDQPYLVGHRDVPDGPGLDPVTVDFDLPRGVWIEGKVTNKVTGKPVKSAVEYFSMYSNPHRTDYPGFDSTIIHDRYSAKEDGTYRIVGIPGPGLVAVYANGSYLRAPSRLDEFGTKERSLETSPYHISFTSNYVALGRIDPAQGAESIKCDVTIDPGWTFKGTVVGPDGKPLVGARSLGTENTRWHDRERMKTAEFTVGAFSAQQPRNIMFQFPEKGLVGVAHPPKENGGSVTVQLKPGAAVTGRLVDAAGKPRPGVELEVRFRRKPESYWAEFSEAPVKTDHDGRFRIEAMFPGYEYQLQDDKASVSFGDGLQAGEVKDLGDVRVKPEP